MKERFGIKDFAIIFLLAVGVGLQVVILVQKDRDSQVLVDRIEQNQKDLRAVTESLDRTGTGLGQLVAVLRGGASATPGGADLSKALSKVESGIDTRPKGDWLVWNLPAEPRNLNPLTSRDLYSRYIKGYGKVFEPLGTFDLDTLKLEKKVLAESWTVSPDGKVITIKIRPEATFSDGKPVTADDVVFTFETIANPKIDCPNIRSYYDKVSKVEKLDRLTVRVTFSETYFQAEETALDTEIIPKHIYEPYVTKDPESFNKIRDDPIVGSGPYKLERWVTGKEVVLVRNENYWGRKPALDRLVFTFIKNPQAEYQALLKGEIDMMAPTPQQYDVSKGDAKFLEKFRINKYSSPLNGYFFIGYNQENPLFQDKMVRRAFTMALDREALIKNVLYGVGQVAVGTFYPEGVQHDKSIKAWPFDLDESKKLLAQAGWKDTDGDGVLDKDGRKLEFEYLMTTDNPVGEQVARYFKDQLQKLGVRVNLSPLEWSVFLEKLNDHKFEVTSLAWGGGGPESDPYQIWHSSQSKDRGSNFISFHNARADELIVKAKTELDPAKRNPMFHEFSRILHDEQPYTFLVARESTGFLDRRFEGVKIHKLRLDPLEWYVPTEKQKRGK